ncbi:sugar phosphate nucleotidyltransferase (plasmid) [Novosphingobium sp. BL-8H]|uniref:sugar nucleotidyltransferase n=1 Tax=Novosphingobium sp. BL-8H TaxID=3127640 RepID=UPI003756F830
MAEFFEMSDDMEIKGLILAGGSGSRLYPSTFGVNKHLLTLCDKPLIYHPISLLMKMGIRDITLVTSETDMPVFIRALGDGKSWGVNFTYVAQDQPRGTGHGLEIGATRIGNHNLVVCLGDNVFIGDLPEIALRGWQGRGARIFTKKVEDPRQFGVVELDGVGRPISVIEKPGDDSIKSAITGMYFLDKKAKYWASEINISSRGEFEITDVISQYIEKCDIEVIDVDESTLWSDLGSHESWNRTSAIIHEMQSRSGRKVGCPEEVSFANGWISESDLFDLSEVMIKSNYGCYLRSLLHDDRVFCNFN